VQRTAIVRFIVNEQGRHIQLLHNEPEESGNIVISEGGSTM
jgi:hypothetical protein